jgi:hypothetical protein
MPVDHQAERLAVFPIHEQHHHLAVALICSMVRAGAEGLPGAGNL